MHAGTTTIESGEYCTFLQRLLDDVAFPSDGGVYIWKDESAIHYGGFEAEHDNAMPGADNVVSSVGVRHQELELRASVDSHAGGIGKGKRGDGGRDRAQRSREDRNQPKNAKSHDHGMREQPSRLQGGDDRSRRDANRAHTDSSAGAAYGRQGDLHRQRKHPNECGGTNGSGASPVDDGSALARHAASHGALSTSTTQQPEYGERWMPTGAHGHEQYVSGLGGSTEHHPQEVDWSLHERWKGPGIGGLDDRHAHMDWGDRDDAHKKAPAMSSHGREYVHGSQRGVKSNVPVPDRKITSLPPLPSAQRAARVVSVYSSAPARPEAVQSSPAVHAAKTQGRATDKLRIAVFKLRWLRQWIGLPAAIKQLTSEVHEDKVKEDDKMKEDTATTMSPFAAAMASGGPVRRPEKLPKEGASRARRAGDGSTTANSPIRSGPPLGRGGPKAQAPVEKAAIGASEFAFGGSGLPQLVVLGGSHMGGVEIAGAGRRRPGRR